MPNTTALNATELAPASSILSTNNRILLELAEAPDSASLDTKQAALLLGLAEETLEVWRSTRRQKIPFYRLGRSVRYLLGDLRKFQAESRVEG